MKNRTLIFLISIILNACNIDYKKNNSGLLLDTIRVNSCSDTIKNNYIIEDTLKENRLIKHVPKITHKKQKLTPKYPILMIVYKGCSGSTAYRYNKQKYEIELIREFSDCPDNPNSSSPKGIYFSKLPKRLSTCYKNYLIHKIQNYKANYLELYNKQFHSKLKVIKPTIDVFYPTILTRVTGNGGSTTYVFDTINKRMRKSDVMHYHYEFPDPNDCLGGDFISELPVDISDSTVLKIKEYMKLKYPKYELLYSTKYNLPLDIE